MKLGLLFMVSGAACGGTGLLAEHAVVRAALIYLGANFFCLSFACLYQRPEFWLKRADGTLNPASYVFFAPLHFLSWTSLTLATWVIKETPVHQVAPNLWLGRRLFSSEVGLLPATDWLAVLDLTGEFPECRRLRAARYLCLPVMDHGVPTFTQLQSALEFISAHISNHAVYVHCALGHGRSATVVAAWLLKGDATLSVASAVDRLRSIRAGVFLNSAQRRALDDAVEQWRS